MINCYLQCKMIPFFLSGLLITVFTKPIGKNNLKRNLYNKTVVVAAMNMMLLFQEWIEGMFNILGLKHH